MTSLATRQDLQDEQVPKRRRFRHDVLISYFSQAVSTIGAFAMGVMIARQVGAVGKGELAVAGAIVATVTQLALLGQHTANTLFCVKHRKLLPFLIGNSFLTALFASIITLVVSYYYLVMHAVDGFAAIWFYPILLSGFVFCNVLISLIQALHLALGQVVRYNLTIILSGIFALGLVGLLFVIDNENPMLYFSLPLASIFSVTLYFTLEILFYSSKGKIGYSSRIWKRCIGYGVRIYIACFLAFMILKSDILVIEWLSGSQADVGCYSQAVALGTAVLLFPATLGTLLFPKLTSITNTNDAWRETKRVFILFSLLYIPLLVVVFAFASYYIPWLYGEEFHDSISMLRWLTIGIYCWGMMSFFSSFIARKSYPLVLILMYLVVLILNVILNAIWIPKYGAIAASWSSSICYMICLIGLVIYACRMASECK